MKSVQILLLKDSLNSKRLELRFLEFLALKLIPHARTGLILRHGRGLTLE